MFSSTCREAGGRRHLAARADEGERRYCRDYEALLGDAAQPALAFGWRRIARLIAAPLPVATDVACGTGRFLPRLCDIANRVYAIDASPAMLARAREGAAGCDVRLLRQDMRALALPEPANLVTCRFASLNYLRTAADLSRAIAAIARALVPGGLFAFDLILDPERPGPPAATVQDVVGPSGRSRWHYRIDPAAGRTTTRIEWIGWCGRPVAAQVHRQQWHRRSRLEAALRAANLACVDAVAMPAGGPSNWFQFVAIRRAADGGR